MIKKSALVKKLASYSVLASVISASNNDANAQIIHTNFNPPDTLGYLRVDLNRDAIFDFALYSSQFASENVYDKAFILRRNSFTEDTLSFQESPLGSGQLLSGNGPWKYLSNGPILLCGYASYYGSFSSGGKWLNTQQKFLPLRIRKKGKDYYGWARLSIMSRTMVLYDYAINTIPGSPLYTGECLGLNSPQFTPEGYKAICADEMVPLKAIKSTLSGPFQWWHNGQAFGIPNDTSILVQDSGVYTLINSGSSCISASSDLLLNHFSKPVINIYCCNFIEASFYPHLEQNVLDYKWYLNDSLIAINHYFDLPIYGPGYYKVSVDFDSACAMSSDSIYADILGIKNTLQSVADIFLSDNFLHVLFSNAQFIHGSLEIFNSLGQSVLQQTISSENFTVNLESLETGIYFVRLEKNGKQIVRKIAVE